MMARALAALVVVLALGGCSWSDFDFSHRENQPEIGTATDKYKRSPCACIEIEQHYPPGWHERLVRRPS